MSTRLPVITQKQRNARRSPTAGNRNNGAKWIRKAKRQRLYQRDNFTCVWCNTPIGAGFATLDHVLPRSQAGTNDAHNLVTACGNCNCSRGDLTPLQFAVKLTVARQTMLHARFLFVEQVLARVLEAIERPLSQPTAKTRAA